MDKGRRTVVVLSVVLWLRAWQMVGVAQESIMHPDLQQFFLTTAVADDEAEEALDAIREAWHDGYAGMVWDLVYAAAVASSTTVFPASRRGSR